MYITCIICGRQGKPNPIGFGLCRHHNLLVETNAKNVLIVKEYDEITEWEFPANLEGRITMLRELRKLLRNNIEAHVKRNQ
jgi:hypothetical protein